MKLWFIELDDGKIYRKALYLMVKTMVSCKFSLKPIQWMMIPLAIWDNHQISSHHKSWAKATDESNRISQQPRSFKPVFHIQSFKARFDIIRIASEFWHSDSGLVMHKKCCGPQTSIAPDHHSAQAFGVLPGHRWLGMGCQSAWQLGEMGGDPAASSSSSSSLTSDNHYIITITVIATNSH